MYIYYDKIENETRTPPPPNHKTGVNVLQGHVG